LEPQLTARSAVFAEPPTESAMVGVKAVSPLPEGRERPGSWVSSAVSGGPSTESATAGVRAFSAAGRGVEIRAKPLRHLRNKFQALSTRTTFSAARQARCNSHSTRCNQRSIEAILDCQTLRGAIGLHRTPDRARRPAAVRVSQEATSTSHGVLQLLS
jgi:hypothetical protein